MSVSWLVDLGSTHLGGMSVAPQTIASDTTTNGSGVDMQLSEGSVHAVVTVGNYGDANTATVVKLQESTASGGSYTDITGATLTLSASATANDNAVSFISTGKRSKRWVRAAVVTSGGGTPSVPISVALLARKKISGTGTGYTLEPTT